ncbi:hypothetical protein AHAS_Ahas11G0192000 [Arachis hypogaea]
MIPIDGDVVPNGRYLYPPVDTEDPNLAISMSIPTTSTAPPKSSMKRIEELHKKLDRYEQRNQRQYTFVKKLLSCLAPPMDEPKISTSTGTDNEDNDNGEDDGHSEANQPLRLTQGTEDRANF